MFQVQGSFGHIYMLDNKLFFVFYGRIIRDTKKGLTKIVLFVCLW